MRFIVLLEKELSWPFNKETFLLNIKRFITDLTICLFYCTQASKSSQDTGESHI